MLHGIDVHTHVVPESFPPYAGAAADAPWPSMQPDGCGHAHVVIRGRNYRTVPSTCWDARARAAEMDGMGMARQVLSPMPELLSYWLEPADGLAMCRWLNDTIARMAADVPERFLGLGAVPLQDLDAALRELGRVVNELGLCGVEIGTHVNGVSIGDPRFEPFFAEATRLGAAVFVHGLRPAGMERLVGPPQLEQVVAFPGDVALAAAAMVTGGTLEKHPLLRIALSHGGGAFPIVLPRLEHGWQSFPQLREAIPQAPSAYASRFYVDTLTYSARTLQLVMETFGPDRVMIGTDYPFVIADRDPHATVDALKLDRAAAQALREGNARRFLGLS